MRSATGLIGIVLVAAGAIDFAAGVQASVDQGAPAFALVLGGPWRWALMAVLGAGFWWLSRLRRPR